MSWCVNADHGGAYAFRLCKNKPELVAKLWGDEPVSAADQEELEACYQEGELRCDGADTNDCAVSPPCAAWPDANCNEPGRYFHCNQGPNSDRCADPSAISNPCYSGTQVVNQIRIPADFPLGKTVLAWRWDSRETQEVFHSCADVIVTGSAQQDTSPEEEIAAATATATPTAKPTPYPATAKPTTADPTTKPTSSSEPTTRPTLAAPTSLLGPGEVLCVQDEDENDSCFDDFCGLDDFDESCSTQSDRLGCRTNGACSQQTSNTICNGHVNSFSYPDTKCNCKWGYFGRCCQIHGRADVCHNRGNFVRVQDSSNICKCQCWQGQAETFCM